MGPKGEKQRGPVGTCTTWGGGEFQSSFRASHQPPHARRSCEVFFTQTGDSGAEKKGQSCLQAHGL